MHIYYNFYRLEALNTTVPNTEGTYNNNNNKITPSPKLFLSKYVFFSLLDNSKKGVII